MNYEMKKSVENILCHLKNCGKLDVFDVWIWTCVDLFEK